jgi:hypothetical protein
LPKVFISYRREDTPGHAGRLYDRLQQEFGADNVFIDVDTLLPGDPARWRCFSAPATPATPVVAPTWRHRGACADRPQRRLAFCARRQQRRASPFTLATPTSCSTAAYEHASAIHAPASILISRRLPG